MPPINPSRNSPVSAVLSVEQSCPICFEPIEVIKTLACTHIFCVPCIDKWLQTNPNCPLCRQKVQNITPEVTRGRDITLPGNLSSPIARAVENAVTRRTLRYRPTIIDTFEEINRNGAFTSISRFPVLDEGNALFHVPSSFIVEIPEEERTYCVYRMTDRVTGRRLMNPEPLITRSGREEIAFYNESANNPIEFSLEPLAEDWETNDVRFRNQSFSLIDRSYRTNPFFDADERQKQYWLRLNIDSSCVKLYKDALANEEMPPFPINSALHQGYVNTHFQFNSISNTENYLGFIKFAGEDITLEKLEEIVDYLDCQFEKRSLYSADLPKKFIPYLEIMSDIPLLMIQNAFRAKGYDCQSIAGSSPESYLCQKASEGDFEGVRELLQDGEDLFTVNSKGLTALHCAVESKNVDLVAFLAEAGGPSFVNWRNKHYRNKGNTPLHCAMKANDEKIAAILIRAGADINAVNRRNETALHLACKYGNASLVKLLIDFGARKDIERKKSSTSVKPNRPLAEDQVYAHDPIIGPLLGFDVPAAILQRDSFTDLKIKCAIKAFAEIKEKYDSLSNHELIEWAKKDFRAVNALIGSEEQILEALKAIANEEIFRCGSTRLSNAIWRGEVEFSYRLIKYGAHIESDFLQLAAFYGQFRYNQHLLSEGNHYEASEVQKHEKFLLLTMMMVDAGIPLEAKDGSGITALHRAIEENRYTVSRYLLQLGANPNNVDNLGNTPLHDVKFPALVELLLAHNADPTLRNHAGILPNKQNGKKAYRHQIQTLLDRHQREGATNQ